MTTAVPPGFNGFAPNGSAPANPFGGSGAPAAPFAAPAAPAFGAPAAPQMPFGAPAAPIGPGMAPAQAPMMGAAPQQTFMLTIAADPTWEPIDLSDTLEMDGYYMGRITNEKVNKDRDGVFFTISLLDQDVAGKTLSKLMNDPNKQQKDIWFTWRNLIRSITGSLDAARNGLQYQVGMFVNQIVYFKTNAYADRSGNMRTGIDSWVTKSEWEEAAKRGGTNYRWPSKAPTSAGVGALPGGLPGGGGFPTAPGGPGGFPAFPGAAPTAAPAAASPMQAGFPTATPQPSGAPIQQAPAAAPPPAFVAPPAPAQPAPVAPPAFAPGQPSFGFAPAAAPATPQPPATAAGIAGSFPGTR